MTALYLGVDAGNSKTAVLVSTAHGEVVGAGRAGCGDIYAPAGPEGAVSEVLDAIDEALKQASVDVGAITSAAFRLAGVDWPEDCAYWEQTLAKRLPDATFRRSILNDGYAAIRCGDPSGIGISVTGGTAAAIAARGRDGSLWDMGPWGQHAMGAIGLAHEAFRAVILAELGEAPPTSLTEALLTHFAKDSVADLNHWLTRREGRASDRERNSCARIVTAAATAQDDVAVEIVRSQGRRLARYAEVAARRTGLVDSRRPVSVVLSGSVLMAADSPVARALLEELPDRIPAAVLHRSELPPVGGALLDALAEGGLVLGDAVFRGLLNSMPPSQFLAT